MGIDMSQFFLLKSKTMIIIFYSGEIFDLKLVSSAAVICHL